MYCTLEGGVVMRKNIELMKSAIESNNHLLIAKLKLEEGWTDEEVRNLRHSKLRDMLQRWRKEGKILSIDQAEELLGDDGYAD